MTPLEIVKKLDHPLKPPSQMLDELIVLYSQPIRFYHTIDHVIAVYEHAKMVEKHWIHPREVYLAILYHDAIYEYGAKDNEARSAVVARQAIKQFLPDHLIDINYVERLINLSATHGSLTVDDVTEEEALFLDCDMAIIGSSWVAFTHYEHNIEQEYSKIYPLPLYKIGRRKFLEKISASQRIFLSTFFHEHFDLPARENLRRALA
jgi:predicted metal-dependent HD superfamily phosphohydrolase